MKFTRAFSPRRMFKLCIPALMAGSMLAAPAWAATGAVTIDAVSDGRGIDGQALRNVRRAVGSAIGAGTVDSFLVYSPRTGGPIPIEGGLSACAEKGFVATSRRFSTFIRSLKAIPAAPGTTIQVKAVASCPPLDDSSGSSGGSGGDPVVCTQDAKICPDGITAVGRIPPSCNFAPCPGAE